jgi:hypothetical protein
MASHKHPPGAATSRGPPETDRRGAAAPRVADARQDTREHRVGARPRGVRASGYPRARRGTCPFRHQIPAAGWRPVGTRARKLAAPARPLQAAIRGVVAPWHRCQRSRTLNPRHEWSRGESNSRPLECHSVHGGPHRPRPYASVQQFECSTPAPQTGADGGAPLDRPRSAPGTVGQESGLGPRSGRYWTARRRGRPSRASSPSASAGSRWLRRWKAAAAGGGSSS